MHGQDAYLFIFFTQGLPTDIREAVHTVMSDPEAIPELPGPLQSAIVEILQPSKEVILFQ